MYPEALSLSALAGSSCAEPELVDTFRYGSEIVNLVADSTVPGGLDTRGWDDDGAPSGAVLTNSCDGSFALAVDDDEHRLRLDDPTRVAILAQRFRPDLCAALDEGSSITCIGNGPKDWKIALQSRYHFASCTNWNTSISVTE